MTKQKISGHRIFPEKKTEENVVPKRAKALLQLDEEHFMQFEDFVNDYEELIYNTKGVYYHELLRACKILLQKEKGLILSNRKLYKGFIQKYKYLLNYFSDNYFAIFFDTQKKNFYKYLKENYDQKDHFLAVIEKLCELELGEIDTTFIPSGDFDGIYEFETSEYIKQGIATDGQITWLPQTSTISYPVQIENANYVLEYKKQKDTRPNHKVFNGNRATIKFKNLSFDIDTLPSYEMLHDFSVDVPIDFETAKQKTDSLNRIELLKDASTETKSLLSTLQSLTQRLEYCEDREEVQNIISKIEEIKQLYSLIETLKPMLYDDAKNRSGLDEEEIQKTLRKKNWGVY